MNSWEIKFTMHYIYMRVLSDSKIEELLVKRNSWDTIFVINKRNETNKMLPRMTVKELVQNNWKFQRLIV